VAVGLLPDDARADRERRSDAAEPPLVSRSSRELASSATGAELWARVAW